MLDTTVQHGISFNDPRDLRLSHEHDQLRNVLHIFDADWHGIRSATGCLPGHKLAITHKRKLMGDEIRHIEGLIVRHGIRAICYQGYSHTADDLVTILSRTFSGYCRQYAVTHVTSAQFEHMFEMDMLSLMAARKREGMLRNLGSVKPDFHFVCPSFSPILLVNLAPRLQRTPRVLRVPTSAFVPVENTWRKNLYTSILALERADAIERIFTVNEPSKLETVTPLKKVELVGYQSKVNLLGYMASCGLVMNTTLAECQPMTQLEALAVGTPTLTGPLLLGELSEHPLGKLTEMHSLDNPRELVEPVERIVSIWKNDPSEINEMIADNLALRRKLSFDSYLEFLELA